jgi:hypothetical protein
MATASAAVTVSTSATLLSAADHDSISGQTLYITNGAADMFMGPSTVTTLTGYKVAASANVPWPIKLGSGEALYGITASSSTVQVLRTGV